MIKDPKFNIRSLGGNIDKIREYMDYYYPQEWKTDKAVDLLCDLIIALELRIQSLESKVNGNE